MERRKQNITEMKRSNYSSLECMIALKYEPIVIMAIVLQK